MRFRVQYETDANNDYFKRDREPGKLILKINGTPSEDYSLNLWNGLATLTVGINQKEKVGNKLYFNTEVVDLTRIEPFSDEFYIEIEKPKKKTDGKDHQVRGLEKIDKNRLILIFPIR
jgi:hypothetical protein